MGGRQVAFVPLPGNQTYWNAPRDGRGARGTPRMSNGEVMDVVPLPLAGDPSCNEKMFGASSGSDVIGEESHVGAAPAPNHKLLLPLTLVDPFSM